MCSGQQLNLFTNFQNVTSLTFFGLKSLVRMSLRGNDIEHLAEGTFNQLSKVINE